MAIVDHSDPQVATPGACHGRLVSMVERVTGSSGGDRLAAAAQLLHDFNVEYDEPAPPPDELAVRLAELVRGDHVTVLLARAHETGAAIGVAVLRVQPSVWSRAQEAYLAEMYVIPSRRGQGYGRELSFLTLPGIPTVCNPWTPHVAERSLSYGPA